MTSADSPAFRETRHASAVSVDGAGVMITGPSGSGKSGLALQLIALGGRLIADDRVGLVLRDDYPWLMPPERLAGVIEARRIGLIAVPVADPAPLRLIVDMGAEETARLPEPHEETVLGHTVLRLQRVDAPYFASAIVALAKGGFWRDG